MGELTAWHIYDMLTTCHVIETRMSLGVSSKWLGYLKNSRKLTATARGCNNDCKLV